VSDLLVSVVIATHDRPARLARLLDGLARQTLPFGQLEVIVVDDGSAPATAAVLEAAAKLNNLQLEVLRHERALGPGAARNAGWRSARASLVAFTDDDCVPHVRWLESALAVHREHPSAIVQGRTEPDPNESDRAGLLSRSVRVERLGPRYETCNMFYPRELLASLGGFDEGFGLQPGGEDTDLACRAMEAGRYAVLASDAVVFHAVQRLGVLGTLRFAGRWTATMKIFAEHPQTRTMLYRGVFWNVWHYLMARSLLVLLAPGWLRRPLLTRHLVAVAGRARVEGAGLWAVPFLILYDLVEMWSVGRGALRHRTPVL
jgi:glycosyltransferase involved in cell wall biosynthesis